MTYGRGTFWQKIDPTEMVGVPGSSKWKSASRPYWRLRV